MADSEESRGRKRQREEKRSLPPYSRLNLDVSERLRLQRETDAEDVVEVHLAEFCARLERVEELYRQLTNNTCDGFVLAREHANAERRHARLSDAMRPRSNDTMRTCWRLSWVIYCRLTVMVAILGDMIQEDTGFEDDRPNVLWKTASHFDYVGNVDSPLSISAGALASYSLRTLMIAANLAWETLDRVGWTPSAGDYVHALFLRYALAVHLPAQYAMDANFGPWAGSEPLLNPAPVNAAFLDIGAHYFFQHAWRDSFLRSVSAPERDLTEWRRTIGLPALKGILTKALESQFSAKVIERLQQLYPSRLVWPGERDFAMLTYPEEVGDGEPEDVLYTLRLDQYKRMQVLLHLHLMFTSNAE